MNIDFCDTSIEVVLVDLQASVSSHLCYFLGSEGKIRSI